MKIYVTDRETIQRGFPVRDGSFVIISIGDPDKPAVRVKRTSGCVDVLQLTFHDAEPTPGFRLPPEIEVISPGKAAQIAEFVATHKDKVKAMVVHCEQGMSRSPAIAAAIAEHLSGDAEYFFNNYSPNAYVLNMVAEALEQLPEGT